jgi:hypothetical protein
MGLIGIKRELAPLPGVEIKTPAAFDYSPQAELTRREPVPGIARLAKHVQ